ncbi:MAG TPA: ABC transporter ATP-binding protein [Desulfobacteraceae bacterium]|nr:ABC transporter ATP-binding protein [Desulfobacteraceae bacterium]
MRSQHTLLAIEDLHVYFRTRRTLARAVEGVDITVNRGEAVCIVGESGCGKTVTALAVMGLIPSPPGEINRGRIIFDGKDLTELTDRQMEKIRGRRIAMVFQEPLTSLNPVFTIGSQIEEAIAVHEEIDPEELKRRTVKLLSEIGLPSPEARYGDYPHQLSGGQRQRVMIAMALACDPDLIIADEPTTALDVTVQAQILNLMDRIQRSREKALLYITHDLGVVANIADRVYVMYAGTVVEQGNTVQIFSEPAHPYTRGLLASLAVRAKRGKRLHSIPGTVPDPARRPPGCPFHSRCSSAVDSCRETFPRMYDLGDGHLTRCAILFGESSGRRKPEISAREAP